MNIKRWVKQRKIGVLCGGRSAEREISLLTGQAVYKALKEFGCPVVCIDAGADLPFRLKKERIDFAFIALHGPWGEDGTVQGMLEFMGIPYSGCGVLSSALAMNKMYTKRMLDAMKLPTAPWLALESSAPGEQKELLKKLVPMLPLVVKPATQGSAIGVSVVKEAKGLSSALFSAFKLDSTVIVEKYVSGTEITVGVLGEKTLPVIEIVPDNAFYDFESKYQPGKSKHLIPPRLPAPVIKKVEILALEVFRALGCRAISRVDMIVDTKGRPWVLEVNTVPGMTETSLYPDAARAAGMSFTETILKVMEYSLIP